MDVVRFLKDKTRIPVIGAPLFTVSYPELVLAQCKAGIVGSLLDFCSDSHTTLSSS